MGNYNGAYEKYYKKINKKRKTSPIYEEEDRRRLNYRKKGDTLGKVFFKEIIFTSTLSIFIFSSFFFMGKGDNTFLVALSNKFNNILSESGYFKEISLENSNILLSLKNMGLESFALEENDSLGESKEVEKEIVAFNDFQVIEKESIDFLRESKVIPFNGEVKDLKEENIGETEIYIEGKRGDVKSILEGEVVDVIKREDSYSLDIKYYEDLHVLYHNLEEVNKNYGEKVYEGEKIGISKDKGKAKGIVVQVLFKDNFISLKNSKSILGE